MGLPLTWITLCMMHLYWIDQACEEYNASHSERFDQCIVCGDDLGASWPDGLIEAYEKVATRCNAKFSAGKHFKSKSAIIFTEIMRVK